MRVMISGATGFIGFHTARELRASGYEVCALVRSAEKAKRILEPIGISAENLVFGDMTDREAIARALEGCDAVVHTAAGVSVTTGQTDFSANLRGTQAVIGQACERGLPSIFVSSMTAIFEPGRPTNDASELVRAKTHYGRSKAECDAWVRTLQDEGAPVALVYPGGVVGPDDPGMSESVKAYRSFLRGTLQTEGGNQMVDVRDLAMLFRRMLEEGTDGRVCAGGHFHDWDAFTALLEEVTGAEISRIRAPGWLLRGAARLLDGVGRVSGRPMPLTGEGVEIATRFRAMQDSKVVSELGVVWRPATDTLRDLFQWFLDEGKLPPRAVPALADPARTS